MIDRQGGKLIFLCDGCDATREFDNRNGFEESWRQCKLEGWTVKKVGGEWLHDCGVPHSMKRPRRIDVPED